MQKDSLLKQLFALLESVGVKAASKHVDEIDHCPLNWDQSETFIKESYNEKKVAAVNGKKYN